MMVQKTVPMTSAFLESGDSYFEPQIDGVIGDREYYDAVLRYTYLQSSVSRLHTSLYIKNDEEYLYLAFKIEDPALNNLMVLRLADPLGNAVSKHSRHDQEGWSLYLDEEDYVEGDTASFSSAWGSYDRYRVVEWKIPYNTTNLNDLKAKAGDSISIAIRYGLEPVFTYPYTYDITNPGSWDWLTTVIPSPIKNGDFEDPIFYSPLEIPGWVGSDWFEPGTGREGNGLKILEGYVGQLINAKEDESLFFLYKAQPANKELPWQVTLDNIVVFELTQSGSNDDYRWREIEIRFSEAFNNFGVRTGEVPLRFEVPLSMGGDSESHPALLIDSVRIGESTPAFSVDDVYVSDEYCDVGLTQEVGFHFSVSPADFDLFKSNVFVNGSRFTIDSDDWIRLTVFSDTVTKKRWVVDTIRGSTDFSVLVDYPSIIWDKVIINVPDSQRLSVGESFDLSATYAYSGQVFTGEIVLNQTADLSKEVGRVGYEVVSIVDDQSEISVFNSNPFAIIHDKVELELTLEDSRIDVGEDPEVSYSGRYLYDSSKFEGTITLSDFSTSVGKSEITVESISDGEYGLSVFESNSVECIWDTIKITEGGASESIVNAGEEVEIWFEAEYAYDSEPFSGDDGSLFINGEEASWSEGKRWMIKVSSDSPTKLSYSVTSIVDDQYDLSGYSSEVEDIEVEWKRAGIPGFQLPIVLLALFLWILISLRKSCLPEISA
jgi:hypothetical protein